MSVLVAKVGRSGAGGANSDYITRLSAAEEIAFYNLEHLESEQIAEARTNAIAYAHAREEIELAKAQTKLMRNTPLSKDDEQIPEELKDSLGSTASVSSESAAAPTRWKPSGRIKFGGETVKVPAADEASIETVSSTSDKPKKERQVRTHYRLIASWEGKETGENAVAEVRLYLEKQFPKARAIIAVHQDTDDTHAHVWIDARQTDGKKIHLKDKQFESLDEKWTEQYDRTYGTNYAPEYKALKEETKQWKREMYQWRKSQGKNQTESAENQSRAELTGNMENVEGVRLSAPPPKPQRAADRFKTDYWREKEVQQITGVPLYEKIDAGTSYSDAQRRNRFTETGNISAGTGDNSTQRTEFSDQGTEYAVQPAIHDHHRRQRTNDENEPVINRTESDFSGTAQVGTEVIRADDRHYQTSESSGVRFTEDETILQSDNDSDDIHSSRIGSFAGTAGSQKVFEEQLYETGYEFTSGVGSRMFSQKQGTFLNDSTIGEFNFELDRLPEIHFDMPEIQMNTKTMIEDTLRMVQNSLERQNKEMSEDTLTLYKEHLNFTVERDPSPILLQKIEEYNRGAADDKFIETENKSWLEANHEYLSNLSRQRLDQEAVKTADQFKEDLQDEHEELEDEDVEVRIFRR